MLIVWNIESGRSKMSGTVLVEGRGSIDIDSCGIDCEYLMPAEESKDGRLLVDAIHSSASYNV